MPAPKTRSVQLPMMQMRASVGPQSFSKEKRTIDIIWSTGKKGLRSNWDGQFYEQLSMDPAHVRMGRASSGATPFLDAHNSYSTRAVLGVAESAKLEAGVGSASIRLVDPDRLDNIDAKDTIRKIEDGILPNISVGYNVYKYERQPMVEGEEIPTYLATDWEPMEFSTVPVGFDEKSVVRGKEDAGTPCVFINDIPEKREMEAEMTEQEKLEQEKKRAAEQAAQAAAEKVEKARIAEEARALEKSRQVTIRSMCSGVKLPVEFADKMISDDKTVEQAREMVIAELAEQTNKANLRTANPVITQGTANQADARKRGMENALMHRANPGIVLLSDEGREFRGMSLLEMARDGLNAAGISTRGMVKMDLATRAFHSTSDFPEVLANVANKSLRKGYEESPRTFTLWAKQGTAPDFKSMKKSQLGEAPQLELVGENGEIKRGTISEGAESYSLATYAKIVAISRQIIINDDLNAFTNIPSKFGVAAAGLESDVVYALLTANAALADSVALFHSTHRNVGTGGVPSLTTLGEFRKLMRIQRGVNNVAARPLNLLLKYLIGPAALETVFDQLCVLSTVPALDTSTNPFKGKLTPITEPRLDANSAVKFYGACDPNQCDSIEYSYLEGQQGVYTETRQGFDVDGMEIKARLDFAAKALDFRGLVYNAGQ